jgi:hypothetical protein
MGGRFCAMKMSSKAAVELRSGSAHTGSGILISPERTTLPGFQHNLVIITTSKGAQRLTMTSLVISIILL